MESLLSKNNMPIIAAAATNNNNVAINNASNVINSSNHHYVNNLSTTPNCTNNNNNPLNIGVANNQTSEDTEMRHRFKVVKLVSSQPYTRGRWTCFDYNDENQNTINIAKHVPANKIAPNENMDNVSLLNDQNINTVVPTNSDQSEVAIDNKIEQAMDLVKSHLMFAVREEVDVLKERIKELESDIQILIAHATPETLALLSNNRSSANANVNVNLNTNNSTSNVNTNPD